MEEIKDINPDDYKKDYIIKPTSVSTVSKVDLVDEA